MAPDGNIYVLASVVEARNMINFPGFGMRKDWLKKLGLNEPDTIEDWYNILKTFKEKDPNDNGQADEIPFLGGIKTLYYFGEAYGLSITEITKGWAIDENGKVQYHWIHPNLKEFLIEMNKWYKDGLLDPDLLSQSTDKYNARAIGNIAGAVQQYTMMFPQWNAQMKENYPEANWGSVIPPKGPWGHRFLEKGMATTKDYFAITRDCKSPEIAIKWLDYVYASEEGKILMGNFGIEGVSYDMIDGKPVFKEEILKSPKGPGFELWALGVGGFIPTILMEERIQQLFGQYKEEVESVRRSTQYFVSPFPNVMSSKEEAQELANVMADIETYVDEMITKFIIGQVSIDNFDKYVQEVKNMNIQKAIEIKQAQYDRASK